MAEKKINLEQNEGLGLLIIGSERFTICDGPTKDQIFDNCRYSRTPKKYAGFKIENGGSVTEVVVSQGYFRSVTHGFGKPVFELEGNCRRGNSEKTEVFRTVQYRPKS